MDKVSFKLLLQLIEEDLRNNPHSPHMCEASDNTDKEKEIYRQGLEKGFAHGLKHFRERLIGALKD